MGTRATIKFKDGEEEYFVYRGHDGYPNNVFTDINATLETAKGRWSNPETGCLVALFIAMYYDYKKNRLPDYDLTTAFHGDESYLYLVEYVDKEYKVSMI